MQIISMIACTHHAAFHVWTLGLAKAYATLHLSMITVYKLQASFLFTESHVLSLGLPYLQVDNGNSTRSTRGIRQILNQSEWYNW